MPIIKPSFDGSNETSNQYDGPPPTPGPYKGEVKGLWLTKIKRGENEGTDMLTVSVAITGGKFKGARLLHNLPVMKNTAWSLNQFLDSLTDGSEKQREVLRKWFWTIGYNVSDDEEKLGRPILRIGKKFDPIGKPVSFVTKMDNYNDTPRAIIDRFVVPLENSDDDDDDEDDGIADTTPEPEPEDESASPPAEDGDDEDDDGDDPWS